MTARVSSWRFLPVALALVLPVLLCVGWSWFHAVGEVRKDASIAAGVVRVQTGTILTQARELLVRLVDLTARDCDEALPTMQRWATLNPYVRALILAQDDRIYCSSAVGATDYSITEFHRWPRSMTPAGWLYTAQGTPMAPDRPAILLGVPGRDGRSGAVVVDGRNLQDIINSVATLGDFQIELTLGEGAPVRSASWTDWAGSVEPVYQEMTDSMNGAKLRISVVVPPQALGLEWQKLLLTYVPLSLLAGALLAWAAYRLQRSRQSYREQLRRAMAAGEFHVEYQPVYSQVTGRFEGVEALMRWMRPGTGLVRPDIFIAAAEQEGVIIELTQHLLGLIERDMREWDTPPGFHVGVNIAPEHLSSEDLVPDVRAFVAATAARQPLLVLEITERSLIEDSGRARRNIDTLRAEGVRVAIDDFGTGHCSLSYLQKFPVDYLKIDKGFVHAIQPDGEEAPVLDVIIMLAHRLGLSVVAEGVEQRFQFDYLTERGVAFIQGYLFSRPLRSADFVAWHARQSQPVVPD